MDEPRGRTSASSSDPDAERLVTVASVDREFEAQTLAAVLEDAGIRAFVFPLASLPLPARPGRIHKGIPIQVASVDAERARQALAASRADASRLDWSTVDVGEPEPDASERIDPLARGAAKLFGSSDRPFGRAFMWALLLLGLFVLLPLLVFVASFFVRGGGSSS